MFVDRAAHAVLPEMQSFVATRRPATNCHKLSVVVSMRAGRFPRKFIRTVATIQMPTVSEHALAVAVAAFAARIRDMKLQLSAADDDKSEDELPWDEIDAHVAPQGT